ncbi:MAG: type II toxin-antitoxin system RelE/ParE family toxin [Candidatus Aenigmarchaeota archaeon]|nr:type II toxin-antitoxin system RelE/ParE family toxin [Candidatus Aenigmarchaeota archaeon]
MYEVIFDEVAIEFLNKLPNDLKERIFKKILSTKHNPFHFFERLEGRKDYKLRVGDYRVIADIDQKTKRIEIAVIGHRRNIYKQI